jgi:hypothetical protein
MAGVPFQLRNSKQAGISIQIVVGGGSMLEAPLAANGCSYTADGHARPVYRSVIVFNADESCMTQIESMFYCTYSTVRCSTVLVFQHCGSNPPRIP